MAGKVVTVAQQKGGAGKTTLAAHLAVAYAAAKRSVAAVDIDPQQSLSQWFRLRAARFGEADTGFRVHQVKGWRVGNEVERLARDHDVVIIDSPPHAETEAKFAVRSADLVVVPVQPTPMDVWATRSTLALAAAEKVPALVVLNRVPPRANLTLEMVEALRDIHGGVAKARLGNRVAFAGSLLEGRAVGDTRAHGRAAEEITALAEEIWTRLG